MTDTDLYLSAEAAALERIMEVLEPMAARLERIDALLSEFEPVIRAVIDPAASGPLAWAVRRKTR